MSGLMFRTRHLLLLATALIAQRAQAETACSGMTPPTSASEKASRPITDEDLIRLRDIGYSHVAPGTALFSVSPDRRSIAVSMFRAEPGRNAYCEAIFIVDRASRQVRRIAESEEIILEAYPIRGVRVDYGYPKVIVPAWSPDGRWVAYLKRSGGRTQVWRASIDGTSEEPLTSAPVDVDRFAWSRDGRAILYESRPALAEAETAIEQEGRQGFLFDERVVPYSGSRPLVRLPVPVRMWRLDLSTRTARDADADADDQAQMPAAPPFDSTQTMRSAVSIAGRKAWVARRVVEAHLSPLDLWAEDRTGVRRRCADSACAGTPYVGIEQLWWTSDGRQLLFLRREGWANSRTALYRWTPGAARAERLLATDDLLLGCEPIDDLLLCAREGSGSPRRLVEIDTATGTERLLVDPNPEFAAARLGTISRMQWRTGDGTEVFGDLVLPPDRPAEHLPLIIVQYLSRGFLRGGIADEHPIQLLASAGYAVLSLNAPSALPKWDGKARNFEQTVAATTRNWAERRLKFEALEIAIRQLVDRGIVDATRVGATGASDGATTVQFALVNRPALFAAASVSSCCEEPTAFMLYGGVGLEEERRKWGFPPARGPGSENWTPLSIALNADSVRTPLLMQLADHEYLIGVDAFMSLRRVGNPVEMRIFPGEFHLKYQPAHRLAVYRRNRQWFDFWLRGLEHSDPLDADQYQRWRDMRAAQKQ